MTVLTQSQIDMLQEVCDNAGWDLRENYSGRGMYGAECIGIVSDVGDIGFAMVLALLQNAADNEAPSLTLDQELQSLFGMLAFGQATDSMGRRVITYWPSLSAPKEGQ